MKRQPQLYVRKYGETEWVLLDLYDAEPIKMNLRVQDVTDPTASVSSYSQTFRVPNTTPNGIFFQQVFNVNQTFFDPSKKAQAYINDNGEFYINGNVTLLNVYVNESAGGIEYEISFMAETSDFASQIGVENKGFLTDLDFTQYNHDLNYQNVVGSWYGNLFQGDVLYPLIEWGYGYTGSGQNTSPIQPTISVGAAKSFTSSLNALRIEQLKPALRVKAIWDAIFANTDYTYESDFLGTNTTGAAYQPASAKDFFMNLYVVADAQARAELTNSIGWKGNGSSIYLTSSTQGYGGSLAGEQIRIDSESYDYGNNFNLTPNLNGQEFTISAEGDYSFRFVGNYNSSYGAPISGSPTLIFSLVDSETGDPIPGAQDYYDIAPNTSNGPIDVTLNYYFGQLYLGKKIKFFVKLVGVNLQNPDPWNPNNFYFYVDIFNYTISTIGVPTKVNPSAALPNQIKQIDFIRSIVERFKLVFEPSKTKPKHFIITPWNDWILGGTVVDWTSKLNAEKDVKISPLFQTQSRYVTYKDQEDSDYLNFYYTQSWKQTYGQRNQDSQLEIIKGTKTIEGLFSTLPIAPIGKGTGATGGGPLDIAAETFLIPHIAKDEVTNDGPGKRTPIQPKLRLGYYNPGTGLVNSSVTWYLDNSGGAEAQTKHPLISSYYPSAYGGNTAPKTLDWKQVQGSTDPKTNYLSFQPDLQGPGNIKNPNGLVSADNYNRFWERWYKATYGESRTITLPDGSSKVVNDFSFLFEGNFILNYDDVKNLKFNDIIFVKDAYYLINYINGYEIGKVSECQVQLFKINNLGLPLPNTYQPLTNICFSNVSLCEAECCQIQSAVSTLFVTDPNNLVVGVPLFVDPRATTLASPGWYRYELNVYEVGANGTITTITPVGTSSCSCVPPLFEKTLCYYPTTGGDSCLACCCQDTNVTVWIPDNTATWYTSTVFYSDYLGYGQAADGWYSDGTNFVQVINGRAQQSGSCSSCNCLIYTISPIVLCYGATKCDAVCCTSNISPQYWIDNPDINLATMLYSNQTGTPAAAGYYYNSDQVLEVNALGEITNLLDPADCYPCSNETLKVYYDFYSAVNGTGAFKIEKSFDAINWLPLNNKDLSTVPAQTLYNSNSAIAPTTYVRGSLIYGLQHDTGTFGTTIEQTGVLLNTQNAVKYTPYTYTPPQFSLANQEYRFSVNLTGSNLQCGITGAVALTCTDPDCVIDYYNSVYNVNSDLSVCCDPLTVTDAGFGSVNDATYFIDSSCASGPPPPPACLGCGEFVTESYAGNDYHTYQPYYICNDITSNTIAIEYSSSSRPNRYNLYDLNGSLVATSGWVGYANYPGPWGASLSSSSNGTISYPYEQGLYVVVEAGPADPSNPISDTFTIQIVCNDSCFIYTNYFYSTWIGDYQSCDGTWYYGATVAAGNSICAVNGTVFTISGTPLTQGSACNN